MVASFGAAADTKSVPAHDGRRPDVCDRIAPFKRPGEQRQIHARHMIRPPGLNSPLVIPRKLPTKNPILCSDRRRLAKVPHAERHNFGRQTNDCTRHRPHGHIVPDPAADRRCFIIATPRGRSLRGTLPYSGLIPAAAATLAHFAVSVRMKSANSSGVFVTASVPIAA